MARQYRALAGAVCIALILPRIAQPGMFVDGVTYAVLARNLAAGIGTFWSPLFSTTVYPVFHEQPPLGIGLEALAFVVLGDHLYVERLFSVLVFAATALLIVRLWRQVLPVEYDWLPLFFWILPSTVTWGAINNMLEGTQALLTTAAVLVLAAGVRAETTGRAVMAGAAAAAAVVAACLTKGPVGLFPLVVPPLALLLVGTERPHLRRAGVVWFSLLVSTAALAAAVLTIDEARHALSEFARTHMMPALEGRRGLPRRSFDIARHFTLGILARMVALAVVLWLIRPGGRTTARIRWNTAWFFLAVGLCASLPLLASPVLAGHYFLPSVPFFALAVATAALPPVAAYRELSSTTRRFMPLGIAAALVLAAAVVLLVRGPMERRDTEIIRGLRSAGPLVPRGRTIGTCESAAEEWGLHGYFQRFFRVSLDASEAAREGWFVIWRDGCQPPPRCVERTSEGGLRLFRCNDAT